MLYGCARCNTTFDAKGKLKRHSEKKTPCDFYCQKCCQKFSCKQSFSKHQQIECKPKAYDSEEEFRRFNRIEATDNSVNNSQKMRINRTQTVTEEHPGKDLNMKLLKRHGFYAHEEESVIFMDVICGKMKEVFDLVMDTEQQYDSKTLDSLLKDLARLFHSNVEMPEYINIMDKNPESRYNKIHNGAEFVDDVMPKSIRNKRVVQRIINKVRTFANLTGISPEMAKFCNKVFVPFLLDIYVTARSHDNLQKTWQLNARIVESMNVDDVPKNESWYLTKKDLKQQCDKMLDEDRSIHCDYASRKNKRNSEILTNSLNLWNSQ